MDGQIEQTKGKNMNNQTKEQKINKQTKEQNMESIIKKFIVEELFIDLSEDEFQSHMSLRDEVGIDSIGFAELIAFIGDQFNINILDSEKSSHNFKDLSSIIKFIQNKQELSSK